MAIETAAGAALPIACPACGGAGLVSAYTVGGTDFDGADECRHCAGGTRAVYANGALAQFPGGPLRGRLPASERPAERPACPALGGSCFAPALCAFEPSGCRMRREP